jgi:predicted  nucleic acid-binding Zn-ribbon protein
MPGPGPILREIHRLRRSIADLNSAIEGGPRQLKAQQNKIAKDEDNVHRAQDQVKQSKVKIHDKEVSIKATQTEIAKYEKQLGEISSKKEYDALRKEIANAKETIRKIEDEILELMLEVDDKAKLVPEAEKGVKKAKDDLAAFERDLGDRLKRYAEEKTRSQAELKQVETTLPEDIKAHYDRLVSFKGEDSIAAVEGQTCTACYTDVTAQMANELLRGEFVLCKSCGRILYTAAAPTPAPSA